MSDNNTYSVEVIDDILLSIDELAIATTANHEFLHALVEYDIICPQGTKDTWRFDSVCIKRARMAVSFQRDMHVNLSGIALALDLLEQIEKLT